MKLAPIIQDLADSSILEPRVALTAQHREMLDQIIRLFGIRPDHDLAVMRPRQSLGELTTRTLSGLDHLLDVERPDVVVVQGDTTSAFVGALAAHYHRIPVVHVEAGLRTTDRYSPYPEEMNRRLLSQLATLHLAPTQGSRANLLREGVDAKSIVVTGNTVIDALKRTLATGARFDEESLANLEDDGRRVVLVTAHRRESWGESMASIGRAVARLAYQEPQHTFVLPAHKNPVVREQLLPSLRTLKNVLVTEPLGYGDFARLLGRSHLVLTDSGGVQEEAPSLGIPVLVMRDNTERPEGIEAGTAKLVGTDEDAIVKAAGRLLNDDISYRRMANAINPYGDGRAATRSVAAIAHLLGCGDRAEEFDASGERREVRPERAQAMASRL